MLISQAIQFMVSAGVPLGCAAKNNSLPVGKKEKITAKTNKQTRNHPKLLLLKTKCNSTPHGPGGHGQEVAVEPGRTHARSADGSLLCAQRSGSNSV